MNREIGVSRRKLSHIEWTHNKVLLRRSRGLYLIP